MHVNGRLYVFINSTEVSTSLSLSAHCLHKCLSEHFMVMFFISSFFSGLASEPILEVCVQVSGENFMSIVSSWNTVESIANNN